LQNSSLQPKERRLLGDQIYALDESLGVFPLINTGELILSKRFLGY